MGAGRCGADARAAKNVGTTALMEAARKGHEGCVRELVAAGADVGVAGMDSNRSLMLATVGGH